MNSWLSLHVKSVLEKGLFFGPTPRETNHHELHADLRLFFLWKGLGLRSLAVMKSLQKRRKPNIHRTNIVYRFVSLKSFPWIFYIFTENWWRSTIMYYTRSNHYAHLSSRRQKYHTVLFFSREMISRNKVIRKKVTVIVWNMATGCLQLSNLLCSNYYSKYGLLKRCSSVALSWVIYGSLEKSVRRILSFLVVP